MLFSPSLRTAGQVSISVLSNLFGVTAKIYYPKGYDSARGGLDAEVQYNDTPDVEEKLLAPFLFSNAKAQFGGFYDELTGDDKFVYQDNLHDYPRGSLIVFNMEAGDSSFIVDSTESNNDEMGKIYSKVRLKPYSKLSFDKTPTTLERNIDAMQYLTDEDIDEDNTVTEFLNDLVGDNNKEKDETMKNLEEIHTSPKYDPNKDQRIIHKTSNKLYSEMELVE